MYKFHNNYIKNKYSKKSRLLFTDIYSCIHETQTKDVYEIFNKDKEMFDFSDNMTTQTN